jgi:hypothetical protein
LTRAELERTLRVATPFVAMAIVALGLRLGASETRRSAQVFGAPPAGGALAWQVVAFEDRPTGRAPLAGAEVVVLARRGDAQWRWQGRTNDDGVAEPRWILPSSDGVSLEVRSDRDLLAQGVAQPPPRMDPRRPYPTWMPFARRSGPVSLDVAAPGQRVAPGFPATLWVRASDAVTHAALARVLVEAGDDPSVVGARAARTTEDGWARLEATPVGLAVMMQLSARAADGRLGEWDGGLFVSPGAPRLETRDRWLPGEAPEVEVVAPSGRSTTYIEIDAEGGRAWATALMLRRTPSGAASATAPAPILPPGLYWAIAAGDPSGAAKLGPGTAARPFVVAASEQAGIDFTSQAGGCMSPTGVRDTIRALGPCLATAPATAAPRWLALDGLVDRRTRDRARHALGLGVSLGGVLAAILLEAALLARAAAAASARVAWEGGPEGAAAPPHGRRQRPEWDRPPVSAASGVVVACLVGLLGLCLVAAALIYAR